MYKVGDEVRYKEGDKVVLTEDFASNKGLFVPKGTVITVVWYSESLDKYDCNYNGEILRCGKDILKKESNA